MSESDRGKRLMGMNSKKTPEVGTGAASNVIIDEFGDYHAKTGDYNNDIMIDSMAYMAFLIGELMGQIHSPHDGLWSMAGMYQARVMVETWNIKLTLELAHREL